MQEQAIELLLVMDLRERKDERTEAIKRALISADKTLYPVLYPSTVTTTVTQKTVEQDLEDTEGGQWKFGEVVDQAEAEEILSRLARQGTGTVTLQDVEREEGDDGW